MARKLGEVLDIEAADSYIKRPAGPMVTIEVKDITKLAGYIRIPSMAEGASTMDTIRQRILYSGLPNQCRKCRKFGHHAWICNANKFKPHEGTVHQSSLSNSDVRRSLNARPPSQGTNQVGKPGLAQKASMDTQTAGNGKARLEAKAPANLPSASLQSKGQTKKLPVSSTLDLGQKNFMPAEQKDQAMAECSESPNHTKGSMQAEAERHTEDNPKPKAKLSFGLLGMASPQAPAPNANSNPFASPSNGNRVADSRNKPQEEDLEGWTFQGRRRHTPKIAMPRQEPQQPPPAPHNKRQRREGKEVKCILRYPPHTSPLLAFKFHQIENSSEQEYGRS